MKIVNQTIKTVLLLVTCLGMLISCSSEIEVDVKAPQKPELNGNGPAFKLVVDPIKEYNLDKDTRAHKVSSVENDSEESSMYVDYNAKPTQKKAKTRAPGDVGEDAEETIDNVWVLQYNGTDNEAKLVSKEFITEIGDDYIIKPNLNSDKKEDSDANIEQTICFIANSNNSSLFSSSSSIETLGKLKQLKSRTYNVQEELTTNGSNLPMAAVYTGKVTEAIKEIKLERMVAKVTFSYSVKLPDKHTFEPKAVQLQECSKGMYYIQPTEPDKANKSDYVDYDMVSLSPGKEITWYIAENIKGTVDKIKFPHQKGGISAPEFASNIQIYGYYSRPTASGDIESFPAVYRIYLGMDNTKSFDTKRNHHYTISATIANVKTTDKRVILPNVALYYFAEENLVDVNKFVSKKDSSYPVGALWNWGRNKPIDYNKLEDFKITSIDDSAFWTYNGQLELNVKKVEDTWTSIIKRQIPYAPKEYIGTNKDYMGELTGDPCPQGYHIPDVLETKALTISQSPYPTSKYTIKVRGITGEYTEQKNTEFSTIVYALKFISSSTNNYLTAYRWSTYNRPNTKIRDLEIRARYLGQAGAKISITDISNPAYWEKNNNMDIVRIFPGGFINDTKTKSKSVTLYYEGAYWSTETIKNSASSAIVFSQYGTGNNILKEYEKLKYYLLPIRCVRN